MRLDLIPWADCYNVESAAPTVLTEWVVVRTEGEAVMAKYAVTCNVNTKWDEEFHYNYRYRSRDKSPVAQDEFDKRRAAGQPAVLWRWDHPNKPVLVDQHNA